MPYENPSNGRETRYGSNVNFSICAVVDLLGFSSHLEMSGYDLRTAIGEQAVQRLQCLEEALNLIREEMRISPKQVPTGLKLQRINDSIICTMDLDDILLPAIGQTSFKGISSNDLQRCFDPDSMEDSAGFGKIYDARLAAAIEPIHQLIGVVARLHLFIQRREEKGFFPGARTVVSTGFRRPFTSLDGTDEILSANFAFSNAIEAHKSLHGPHFYIDNNVTELCSRDGLALNLFRLACFEWADTSFDCLRDEAPTQGTHWREATEVSTPELLVLFRRRYLFRRLNASPLSFLQHLSFLRPCIAGEARPDTSNPYFIHILDAVRLGISGERIQKKTPPKSFVYGSTNDLQASLVEFGELLLTGDSPTRTRRRRLNYLKEQGHPELIDNKEYLADLEKLENKVIELPSVEPLTPADLGDVVWQLDEEEFSGLLPFFSDDHAAFEYPRD